MDRPYVSVPFVPNIFKTEFQNSEIYQNMCLKWFAICLVSSFKYSGNEKWVEGPGVGEHFWSSKNVSKNIGICPQALIRHFKPIRNHENSKYYNKYKTKSTNSLIVCPYRALNWADKYSLRDVCLVSLAKGGLTQEIAIVRGRATVPFIQFCFMWLILYRGSIAALWGHFRGSIGQTN